MNWREARHEKDGAQWRDRGTISRSATLGYTIPDDVCGEVVHVMYPFMTLSDGTEIVHSETLDDGRVKVYMEKPDAKDGFHHVTCYLPDYAWEDAYGFSDEELAHLQDVVSSTANLILEFAADGGFEHASGF